MKKKINKKVIKRKLKRKVSKIKSRKKLAKKFVRRKNPDFLESLENLVRKQVEIIENNGNFIGILQYLPSKLGRTVPMFKVNDKKIDRTIAFFPDDVAEISYPDGYSNIGMNFGKIVKIILK